MATYQSWRNRAIFISSTFKDMQAERDVIRTVSLDIEEELRKQHQHLELVDLRWGLDTSNKDEEEAKEIRVLKVCLSEIDRCKPFMIVLIGDRYGWIPNQERVRSVTEEKDYHHEINDKSITALEIEYGILNSPEQRKRSFFYFRETLPEEEMTAENLSCYFSKHNPAEGDKAQQELNLLKKRIKETMGDRVKTYPAKWDQNKQEVTGLDKFAEMIKSDILQELKEEAKEEGKVTSWQEEEAIFQNAFIADRTKSFAGRTQLINNLMSSLLSQEEEQPKIQVYTGESGTGKSSIFSELVKQLSEKNETQTTSEHTNNSKTKEFLLLAHACGISQRSGSVESMLGIWIKELSTYLDIPDKSEEKQSTEDTIKMFGNLLHRASEKTRVILLVDALNQLERTAIARQVQWLPVVWPENVRLLTTTIQGSESEALKKRGAQIERLKPLIETEKDDIIKTICDTYHKKIKKQEVLENLKKKQDSPNPLYLSIALQDLMLMDQDDFQNAEKAYTGTAEEKLVNLILDSVKKMPESVEGIYGYILRRAEKEFGKVWVRSVINYIGISRFGLREKDLEALVCKDTEEAWDSLKFACLRRMLRVHIIYRGQEGVWDYTHQQFRKNILQVLLDQEQRQNMHRNLANHLQKLSDEDSLKQKEIMYHYYHGDMKKEAAIYYANGTNMEARKKATKVLSEKLKEDSGSKNEKAITWIGQLLSVEGISDETRIALCERIDFDIRNEVGIEITPRERIWILDLAKNTLDQVIFSEKNTELLNREKLANLSLLAHLYQGEGRKKEAQEYYEKGLRISKELSRCYPEKLFHWSNLSVSLRSLGDWYKSEGKKEKALTSFNESLGIWRKLSHNQFEEPSIWWGLSDSLDSLGDWYESEGKKEKACLSYEESLEIRRELSCSYPKEPSYRRNLSASLINMGNWYQSEGKKEKARNSYEESLGIFRVLSSSYPEESSYRRGLRVSLEKMGDWYQSEGAKEKARTCYEESLEIGRELSSSYPEELSYRKDLSISLNKLSGWYQGEGAKERACTCYEESLEIRSELSRNYPEEPSYRSDLSLGLIQIGDWYQSEGAKKKARTCYEESLEINENLSRSYPEEPSYRRNLGISLERLGDWYQGEGAKEKALTSYEESLEIRRDLSSSYPEEPSYRSYLSVCLEKMGNWYQSEGKKEKALNSYEESLGIRRELSSSYPEVLSYRSDLSVSLIKLGDWYQSEREKEKARTSYDESIEIRRELSRSYPQEPSYRRNLSVSLERLGNWYQSEGKMEKARTSYEESLEIFRELSISYPEEPSYQRGLSISLNKVGDMYKSEGAKEKALNSYEESLGTRRDLCSSYPEELSYRSDLSISLIKLGNMYKSEGEKGKARTSFKESLEIRRELSRCYPEEPSYRRDLSTSLIKLGDWYQKEGEKEKARTLYEESIGILRELSSSYPEESYYRSDLGAILAIIAITSEDEEQIQIEKVLEYYKESLEMILVLRNQYPKDKNYADMLSMLREKKNKYVTRIENEKKLIIPPPHRSADPKRAMELNIEYQKMKKVYDSLPWWKKISTQKPEAPKN